MRYSKSCLLCGLRYNPHAANPHNITLNAKNKEALGLRKTTSIEVLECPGGGKVNIKNDKLNDKYQGLGSPYRLLKYRGKD